MASLNDIETKVHHIIDLLEDRPIKTITGVLPLTFTSTEDKLRYWEIMGNDDVYEGQQGVGERTENLFDISSVVDGYINAYGVLTAASQLQSEKASDYIEIDSSTAYTISAVGGFPSLTGFPGWRSIAYFDSNKSFLARTASEGTSDLSATSGSTAKYVRISYRSYGEANLQIMLVKGSTAPSTYVPYGYKIPISVNGTPQTFYIGDSPLTAGQSISKTSTGTDIATEVGDNTISTTLYNKPEMTIKYKY